MRGEEKMKKFTSGMRNLVVIIKIVTAQQLKIRSTSHILIKLFMKKNFFPHIDSLPSPPPKKPSTLRT
jgi:hypothetical protein